MDNCDQNCKHNDPLREGIGFLLKGLGWGFGFVGFGLMWAFSNGVSPF